MTTQAKHQYFTPEEYLELERQSPFKHEYQRGLVYAMAGAKNRHVWITGNLHVLLANHLADSFCVVSVADMKVRIEVANCYYYPDISVTCNDIDLKNEERDFILAPQLIIEVLSKTTEQFDRTEKFEDYQKIPELQEYILVSQDKVQVECYRKQASDEWKNQHYEAGDVVEITSVGFRCSIEKIYNKVLGIMA